MFFLTHFSFLCHWRLLSSRYAYKLFSAKEQTFGERGMSAAAFLFTYFNMKEVGKCISFYEKQESQKCSILVYGEYSLSLSELSQDTSWGQ